MGITGKHKTTVTADKHPVSWATLTMPVTDKGKKIERGQDVMKSEQIDDPEVRRIVRSRLPEDDH